MSYCTVQDLENYYLGKEFKCGSLLSNGKAEDFIASDSALIDATLKTRYTLPIIETSALLILKMINEKMVVGTIDDIFREKDEEGKFNRGRDTRKEALDLLKKIKEGDLILDASGLASVIKFNNIDSNDDEVTKPFKISKIEPRQAYVTDRERRGW